MSYDTTPHDERLDRAFGYQDPPRAGKPDRHVLDVTLEARASALPRLFNLISKLDLEPDYFRTVKSSCGERLLARIDLGGDRSGLERLKLRLQGLVTVLDVREASDAAGFELALPADDIRSDDMRAVPAL